MPGFMFKGTISWNKKPAMLDASLDLMNGLKLTVLIPELEVGPFKVKGHRTHTNWPSHKFAGVEMEVSLLRQAFVVSGEIFVFDAWTECNVHVEHKPVQTLRLNFNLKWNELINISLHANAETTSHVSKPEQATLNVHCVFEQGVKEQLFKCLNVAKEEISEFAQKGIGSLEDTVKDLEGKRSNIVAGLQTAYDFKVKELEEAQRTIREQKRNKENDRNSRLLILQADQTLAESQKWVNIRAATNRKLSDESHAQSYLDMERAAQTARKEAKERDKAAAETDKAHKSSNVGRNRSQEMYELYSRVTRLSNDLANTITLIFL